MAFDKKPAFIKPILSKNQDDDESQDGEISFPLKNGERNPVIKPSVKPMQQKHIFKKSIKIYGRGPS
jgi:hypothetical protein